MSNPRERIVAALEHDADHCGDWDAYAVVLERAIAIVERELPDVDDTADELAKLLAHNTELLKKHQWQPIETAPRDGSEFLSWSELSQWVTHWDEKSKIWKSGEGYGLKPTHWMPLPEPPEVSGE